MKKKDIRHGNSRNLSALKLIFLKQIIDDIKNKKLTVKTNIKDKADPYNERQTVDIDVDIEYEPDKKPKKSKYASWS